jgi:hypothetical protein
MTLTAVLKLPTAEFLELFSSGDHFYQSECYTDRPTLVPFESKLFEILNYSVWYAVNVNVIIFFVFFVLMFNLRGPQGQNPRTTVWETLAHIIQYSNMLYRFVAWEQQAIPYSLAV